MSRMMRRWLMSAVMAKMIARSSSPETKSSSNLSAKSSQKVAARTVALRLPSGSRIAASPKWSPA